MTPPLASPDEPSTLDIPLADDFHVHLRQDIMQRAVVPAIRLGGVGRVLVMPNTIPAISTCKQAQVYHDSLRALDTSTDFRMTLYLGPSVSVDDLHANAHASGVTGVKMYPKGVTTNSDGGVECCQDFSQFFPHFREMERLNLTLHIHGEQPGRDVLTAESAFLPQLESLHNAFPHMRIVLEHVTSKEAVDTVKRLGSSVGATVTAHHLDLTIDDVVGSPFNFCKPVAKRAEDRDAIRNVVFNEGHRRFFLGSDSAPHPISHKNAIHQKTACAGVFTQPFLMSYLADSFAYFGAIDKLPEFVGTFGAQFFGLTKKFSSTQEDTFVRIYERKWIVPSIWGENVLELSEAVVPYRASQTLEFYAQVVARL